MLVRGRNGVRFLDVTCHPVRSLGESPVVNDLAYTPSDIERLARNGTPVSVPNSSNFLPSDPSEGWNVPPEFKTDMDRNTAWESEQAARSKIMSAYTRDKKLYG